MPSAGPTVQTCFVHRRLPGFGGLVRRCVGDVRVSSVRAWSVLRACLACSPLFGLLPLLADSPSRMSTVSCVWPVLGTVLYGAVRTLYGCGLAARRRNGATCRGDGQPPGFLSPVPWRHGPARARRRQGGRDRADGRARVRVTCRCCFSLPFRLVSCFPTSACATLLVALGPFLRPPKGGQRSGLAASPCLLVRGGSGDGGEEEKDRLPHTLILYCIALWPSWGGGGGEGYQVADLSGLDTMLGNVESPGSFFYRSVSGTLSSDSFFCYPSGD